MGGHYRPAQWGQRRVITPDPPRQPYLTGMTRPWSATSGEVPRPMQPQRSAMSTIMAAISAPCETRDTTNSQLILLLCDVSNVFLHADIEEKVYV